MLSRLLSTLCQSIVINNVVRSKMDNEVNFPVESPQDHCYSKPHTLDIRGILRETLQVNGQAEAVSPALTPLDKTHDNFESLLLKLLQAYTMQSSASSSNPKSSSIGLRGVNISGDALDTLSPEQVSALITSNSVNYEVIQQILSQQKQRSRRSTSPPSNVGSPHSPNNVLTVTSTGPAMMEFQRETSYSGPSSPHSPKSPVVISNSASGNDSGRSTPPIIQISADQLALLQSQVQGLLQSRNVPIPSEVSPDVIQSLILRQLGGTANMLLRGAETSRCVPDAHEPMSTVSGQVVGGASEGSIASAPETGNDLNPPAEADVLTLPTEGSILNPPVEVNVMSLPAEVDVHNPPVGSSVLSTPFEKENVNIGGSALIRSAAPRGRSRGRAHAKGQGSSRPTTLSGAAISAVQASSTRRGSGTRGRGRGRGRGGNRGVGRGRRAGDGGSIVQRRTTPLTPTNSSSPAGGANSLPSPFELFHREVFSTVSVVTGTEAIPLMWEAMGQDVKQRYYDEHERLKEQAERERQEEERQKELELERSAIMETALALSAALGPHLPPAGTATKITVGEATSVSSMEIPPQPDVIEKIDLEPIFPHKDEKLCVCSGCENLAVYSEDRGPSYCSYECVVSHCRNTFELFVSRKLIHC